MQLWGWRGVPSLRVPSTVRIVLDNRAATCRRCAPHVLGVFCAIMHPLTRIMDHSHWLGCRRLQRPFRPGGRPCTPAVQLHSLVRMCRARSPQYPHGRCEGRWARCSRGPSNSCNSVLRCLGCGFHAPAEALTGVLAAILDGGTRCLAASCIGCGTQVATHKHCGTMQVLLGSGGGKGTYSSALPRHHLSGTGMYGPWFGCWQCICPIFVQDCPGAPALLVAIHVHAHGRG